jgi:2-dehydropantoate 2-reductase
MRILRIAVVGAGGIGGYFGGRWADAGLDVTFVARGAQLSALRANGLTIRSALGDVAIPVQTAARASEVGKADLVLVATKAWQLPGALEEIAPLVDGDTLVLGLQNGVEAAATIGAALGERQVIEGTCRIISYIEAPGVIRHAGAAPMIVFGEAGGGASARTERVRDVMARGQGMEVVLSADVRHEVWRKFHWFAPVAGVGSVTRSTAGAFRSAPETRAMLIAAMNEVLALAHAHGAALAADETERAMRFVDSLPADATSTMMRDFRDGKRTELETLSGAVGRLGRRAGIATPVNDFIYAALLPQERAARTAG